MGRICGKLLPLFRTALQISRKGMGLVRYGRVVAGWEIGVIEAEWMSTRIENCSRGRCLLSLPAPGESETLLADG